jgi:hypothetical protein
MNDEWIWIRVSKRVARDLARLLRLLMGHAHDEARRDKDPKREAAEEMNAVANRIDEALDKDKRQ